MKLRMVACADCDGSLGPFPLHTGLQKMRILHVTHTLAREAGGPPVIVKGLSEALAERGHHVTVISVGEAGSPQGESLSALYETKVYPAQFKPFAISAGAAKALRSIRHYDIVHTHMIYRFPQAAAIKWARWYGVPYCVQPHGALDPILFHKRERIRAKRLYETLVEKRNLDRATGIMFTADAERDRAAFLNLKAPSFVIPNGFWLRDYSRPIDPSAFRERHNLIDREIVLWMGRITPVKGLDLLAEAFTYLSRIRPKATLVIAGPDSEGYAENVRQNLAQAGIADRVIFTGMILGDEKLAALRAANVFALPSYSENFGLVVVEAMAVGCPVVVTEGVKIWKDIIDVGAGIVTQLNAIELATALSDLLANPEQRLKMGGAAAKLAGRYDWSAVISQFEHAYRDMMTSAAARRNF